jgi:thioredoxin reductase (NADPH)
MEAALADLLRDACGERPFTIESIDVDQDELLEDRFGERVPVLVAGEKELCHYFLDTQAVRAYLADIR